MMKSNFKKIFYFILCIVLVVSFLIATPSVHASQFSDLQQQIDTNNALLNQKRTEANSLQKQVDIFDTQIKDAELQISKTQIEVDQTRAKIVQTQAQIAQQVAALKVEKGNLYETLTVYYENQNNNQSIFVTLLGSESLSSAIDKAKYLEAIGGSLTDEINKINKIMADLQTQNQNLEKQKKESNDLLLQQKDLKASLDNQKTAKNQLLTQTKGQEADYQQKLNAAWKEYQDALSRSSQSNESSYLGGSGSGYLINPNPGGHLTQEYGCTSYARCGDPSGPYGGNIHNGLDIAADYGSSIKAAADGSVLDRGMESNSHGWGNWIIIKHSNGLATLYAHLSSFRVSVGQNVSQGDVIGLEGNTGNSTGPHLHFSVFTHLIIYNGSYHGPDYSGTVDPRQFL